MKPPLIFIHGVKGAILTGPDGVRWLTGWQALGLRTPRLRLPLRWDGQSGQARDELSASGPLERVRALPGLIEEVYGPWLEAARRMGGPFFAFTYDWRRDNLETLASFEQFVEQVRREAGGSPVRVVAHSMGGLVTLALLNRHPEYFHSVVFAGAPLAGGIAFLQDLHAGTPAGLNRRILSPEVLFTFPSVYSFFPLDGSGLVDQAGGSVAMDFFSAADWKRQRLGAGATDADWEFLGRALARAKEFRMLLEPRAQDYPPVLVVASEAWPTLVVVVRNGPRSERGWDFESAQKAPGDGRVALRNSLPPSGIPHRLFKSRCEHSQLLNDVDAIREIARE